MAAKTVPTGVPVAAFLETVAPPRRRQDAELLLPLFARASGEEGVMWGPSIIGYGRYSYTYKSGRVGEWPLTGFSPRKADMVVYVMPGFEGMQGQLAKLGPHKTGASCLYLGALEKIDLSVLEVLVAESCAAMRAKWGA